MKEQIVDIMDKYIDSILDDVHTMLPGQIVTYYGHKQRKAKVRIMVKLRNTNNQVIEIQPIDDVPIIFPSTSSFNMIFPLQAGDGVMVLFSESSLGAFLSGRVAVDADDQNRFMLTDAVAIPGLWSFNNIPAPLPEDETSMIIKYKETKLKFTVDNEIEIDNGAGTIEMNSAGDTTISNAFNTLSVGTASVQVNGTNLEVLP